MVKSKLILKFKDFIIIVSGSALIGLGVSCFAAPNGIVAGGLSGLATIIGFLTSLPIGFTTLAFNIPIFIVGTKKLGFDFLKKSIIASVLVSIFIDVFSALPSYTSDRLVSALYSGVLSGLGVSLVFLQGATTGGVDIIAKIISAEKPHFTVGRLILIMDFVVIIIAIFVYKNFESGLYSVIAIFIQSQCIDIILKGADKGTLVLVNSAKNDKIAKEIINTLSRGATLLNGKGAYSGVDNHTLICALRVHEVVNLKRIVREIDPAAFIILLEAHDILGEGFKKE